MISLSFANVKEDNYQDAILRICQILTDLYHKNAFLLQGDTLSEAEKQEYGRASMDMPGVVATMAIHKLAEYLSRYYGQRAIVLLDEYDTPMQEAYVRGYWDKLASFMRNLFNATFKTNPYLERAIMTGITRISKESIFSDLNNIAGRYGESRPGADRGKAIRVGADRKRGSQGTYSEVWLWIYGEKGADRGKADRCGRKFHFGRGKGFGITGRYSCQYGCE